MVLGYGLTSEKSLQVILSDPKPTAAPILQMTSKAVSSEGGASLRGCSRDRI